MRRLIGNCQLTLSGLCKEWQEHEFEASLGYMLRHCLKMKKDSIVSGLLGELGGFQSPGCSIPQLHPTSASSCPSSGLVSETGASPPGLSIDGTSEL